MSIEQALSGSYSFYNDPVAALQNYNEYGFHVEKNFFTPAYCDAIIEAAHTLSGFRANNFKPALMPHKENPQFLAALKYEKTVHILRKILGDTPTGIQSQFFYCKPGTRGFSLHQDNFYVQADVGTFVSVWIALVDTVPTNGGLIIYPGSHSEGNLPIRQLDLALDVNQDKNANNEETIVPLQYKPVNLVLPKGDALFIHAHLVHGSNPNASDSHRYSLLNLYLKEGAAFRSGNSARREPIALV